MNIPSEIPPNNDGYWDIEDLSRYLKVKTKTLYAMSSKIPHYRVGKLLRFRKQEIDSWMENLKAQTIEKTQLRAVKHKRKDCLPVDKLIRKAIDQTKLEGYNHDHGKSDRIKGPEKEINHGSI